MYDILIKNGTIVDGTGARAKRGDVGIKGEKIFAVGENLRERGRQEIDAGGLVIAPGFVDVQNHSDSYGALIKDPTLESMVRQGITTILVGQCGSSLAPLLNGSLASIQKWTSIAGINVDWSSVAEFLKILESKGLGINIATLIGHSTLRRDFVGDEPRPLSTKEKKQIESLLKRSMREGAWGLSVGLAYTHERASEENELIDFLSLVAKSGGVASFHLRNEGDEIVSAIEEVVYLSKKSGVRAKVSHFKTKMEQNPERIAELLAIFEKAKKDKAEVWFDVYPYTTSTVVLYLLLPEWATERGRAALLAKLKDKSLRKEISKELEAEKLPYDKITIASGSIDRTVVGRTVADIAERQQRRPQEVIFDLLLSSEDQILVFFKNIHEPVVETLLKHPQGMISTDGSGWSAGDSSWRGLEHPRSFGTTARVFSRYVRDKKTLKLEKAVYKMAGLPAEFMGLEKRGAIKEGYYADIVLFDKNNVDDLSSFENPYRYPVGIPYVLLNGKVVVDDGRFGGDLAGKIIKKS